jgi:hypothetical protein
MALKFDQGKFPVKNPQKYVGKTVPIYRSSWEKKVMLFFDNSLNVLKWSSEPIRIPYIHPETGKGTNYVPDFLVVYLDQHGKEQRELMEVKPASQTTMEAAGKSKRNQSAVRVNEAKWEAAVYWCQQNDFKFRIVTENELFRKPPKRKR